MDRFQSEPLPFLCNARAELGDLFVLREGGPIFSRRRDCRGVVAAFGAVRQRRVLTDPESFGMPPSAARKLNLRGRLANLNRSLHSMRGEQHTAHKRILTAAIDSMELDAQVMTADLQEFASGWQVGKKVAILGEMRRLAVRLGSRLLFGEPRAESERLASLLEAYFHLRREAASPASMSDVGPETLVELGEMLDNKLRAYGRRAAPSSLLGRLAQAGLAEHEVVGHSNIFFVSITEPIAVALTWTLLVLSQLPGLREELRGGDDGHPSLLDCVICESLRILPPNAIMVRITTKPTTLVGTELLPDRCEVVLSPFVAHRDPDCFPRPDEFRPSRWRETRPSPFDYFPFGAGAHACIGRGLTVQLMKAALAFLLARFDLVLDGDQAVDWRLHIMFMPACDPSVMVQRAGTCSGGGRLTGPLSKLLRLSN